MTAKHGKDTTREQQPDHVTRPVSPDPAPVTADDVISNVERPTRTPEGVTQINAVLTHSDSGRTVRRMFVYDERKQEVRHTEVGLVNGNEVYALDHDWPAFRDDRYVFDEVLGESFDFREYARMIGFDAPAEAVSTGFEENMRVAHGMHPFGTAAMSTSSSE